MKALTKRNLSAFFHVHLPFFGSPVLAFLSGWYIVHQYEIPMSLYKDGVWAIGCTMFMFGFLAGIASRVGHPFARVRNKAWEISITFNVEATKAIFQVQHYLEHPDSGQTIATMLKYYMRSLEFVRDHGGTILWRDRDGVTERKDPLTLNSRPATADDPSDSGDEDD